VSRDVERIAPALLAPALPVTVSAGTTVRAAAHELNGAVYVVVANPMRRAATARVAVPGLGARELAPLDGSGSLSSSGGTLTVRLAPLGARVYVAAPA
jgi:hypothetical protein